MRPVGTRTVSWVQIPQFASVTITKRRKLDMSERIEISLVAADDMVSSGKKKKERKEEINGEDIGIKGEEKKYKEITIKKKREKPVRILRIKHYGKIELPFMDGKKLEHKVAYAVNRGLDDLLKALYYNTNIRGSLVPDDCIFVEKDDRIGATDKFIFIEISRDEFYILKRELENSCTIYSYNKGEFIITEGRRSYLEETWNMPRIWRK